MESRIGKLGMQRAAETPGVASQMSIGDAQTPALASPHDAIVQCRKWNGDRSLIPGRRRYLGDFDLLMRAWIHITASAKS